MITVNEAIEKILQNNTVKKKIVSKNIVEAIGYVLAEDVFTDRDYPPFNRSTMDGYAIVAQDLNSKKEKILTNKGTLLAGDANQFTYEENCCIKIMTGAPVPQGFDSVIKIEDTSQVDNEVTFSIDEVKLGQNIAKQGEDIRQDQLAITKGSICNHSIISILATIGKTKIDVYELPTIAIISTGSEVIESDKTPLPHQIRDSNSYALRGLLKNLGITPKSVLLINDTKDALEKAVIAGLKFDILILSGGVSMGEADFVPQVLEQQGIEKIFHKVKVKPGKPIWFGNYDKGVVFGLPGNPFSCMVGFKIFIEPLIYNCLKLQPQQPMLLPMSSSRKKRGDRTEFLSTKIVHGATSKLKNIDTKGSGDITASLNSSGLALQEAQTSQLNENDIVKFYPWKRGDYDY